MVNRQDYIYELVGKVLEKKPKKKKDGASFWQLTVNIPEIEKIKKINVFSDGLDNQKIWKEIEKSNYIRKEYIFYCKNFMGSYYLVDWKIWDDEEE